MELLGIYANETMAVVYHKHQSVLLSCAGSYIANADNACAQPLCGAPTLRRAFRP
jgi:hypothetical protein